MEAQDKHKFMTENKYILYELYELQDLMIRAGYINPEEAKNLPESSYDSRMERASEIFYDYVQNYAPELMSPQYQGFFDASEESKTNRGLNEEVSINDTQDFISLESMSEVLIGLSDQALSFRREANDKDYMHKFYEDLALKGEIRDKDHEAFKYSHLWESTTVRMARDYLKAWDIFEKENESLNPRFLALIEQSPEDLNGQL